MQTQLKLIGGGFIALLLIVVFLMTYFTVDQNQMTAVTRMGALQYVAEPGLHFKVPFVNATEAYRTDIQSMKPDQPVNTYTIDNQEIDILFTVFYRVPPKNIGLIFTNNRDYRERLFSLVVDRLKSEVGQINVQHVAEKRGELRDKIKAVLARDSQSLYIEVTDFQLTELEYTKDFRAAVNSAAVQKANIEKFEYERQQSQKSAETAKIKAEGEANAQRAQAAGAADARLLQATAEAKAIQLQGEAQAAAIEAQAKALASNAALVELRKAERWNGALPTQVLGSVATFMDVNAKKP